MSYRPSDDFGRFGRPVKPSAPHPRKFMPRLRATTILALRHQGAAAIGGDGQVTLGNVVMKSDAHKIRRLHGGKVLCDDIARSCINGIFYDRHLSNTLLRRPRRCAAQRSELAQLSLLAEKK